MRFFAMKFAAKRLCVFFFLATCMAALRAQTIQIVLISGKTGRPIKEGYSIGVKIGDVRAHAFEVSTDKHGLVGVRLTDNESEVNVPECRGMKADEDRLLKNWNKADDKAFRKKYPYKECEDFGFDNPIVLYGDSITIETKTEYVPCWPTDFLFGSVTHFSTADVLQRGVVTANTCGNAAASAHPGRLVLFARPPTHRELWSISN